MEHASASEKSPNDVSWANAQFLHTPPPDTGQVMKEETGLDNVLFSTFGIAW